MNKSDQETMDSLSRTVTALAQAIDPEFSHGPETEKLVKYATKTRRLAHELSSGVFVGNRTFQINKAHELKNILGLRRQPTGEF